MRIFSALSSMGCAVILCLEASASVLSISPTRLAISPDSKASVFNLKNAGDEKALVEVKVYEWTDSNDRDALVSTDDLLVAPPIFEIKPDEAQVLRIVPRLDDGITDERMYRLIVKEVPSDVGPANGVGFAVEMSLPIFVAPKGASAKPIWSLRWKDIATPELALSNQGDAHVRVRSLELFEDPEGNPLFASDEGVYVLPGKEKVWPLEFGLAQLKGPATVRAETTAGLIETQVSPPGG